VPVIEKLKSGFVGPGEKLTYEHLSRHLPEDWFGVALKEVVAKPTYVREADFILVGRSTVFVLEEKHWQGRIRGDENWWFLGTEVRRSPLAQASEVARLTAMRLKEKFPSLRDEWLVEPFVILSSPHINLQLSLDEKRCEQITTLQESVATLQRFDGRRRSPFVNVTRQSVAQFLGSLPGRRVPERILLYDIIESLPPTGPFKNWRARHSTLGDERTLRVIAIPNGNTKAERDQRLTPIIRESLVYRQRLEKLAMEGRIPRMEDMTIWDDDFYVFPLHVLPGQTLLSDRAGKPSSMSEVLETIADAFRLLAEVHEAGVVHRNLAPSRIFIRPDGRVAFSDFLVAKVEGENTVADRAWEFDPERDFTAPEILKYAGRATAAADIYGLAASFAYWLSGYIPKPDASAAELAAHSHAPDRNMAELIATELCRCLVSDPKSRPIASAIASTFA
jgi:serine/threonine protein kinase